MSGSLQFAILIAIVVIIGVAVGVLFLFPAEQYFETCKQKTDATCHAGQTKSCTQISEEFVLGVAECRAEPECDPAKEDCCNWDLSECSKTMPGELGPSGVPIEPPGWGLETGGGTSFSLSSPNYKELLIEWTLASKDNKFMACRKKNSSTGIEGTNEECTGIQTAEKGSSSRNASFRIQNLSRGTYYVVVREKGDSGWSNWSTEKSVEVEQRRMVLGGGGSGPDYEPTETPGGETPSTPAEGGETPNIPVEGETAPELESVLLDGPNGKIYFSFPSTASLAEDEEYGEEDERAGLFCYKKGSTMNIAGATSNDMLSDFEEQCEGAGGKAGLLRENNDTGLFEGYLNNLSPGTYAAVARKRNTGTESYGAVSSAEEFVVPEFAGSALEASANASSQKNSITLTAKNIANQNIQFCYWKNDGRQYPLGSSYHSPCQRGPWPGRELVTCSQESFEEEDEDTVSAKIVGNTIKISLPEDSGKTTVCYRQGDPPFPGQSLLLDKLSPSYVPCRNGTEIICGTGQKCEIDITGKLGAYYILAKEGTSDWKPIKQYPLNTMERHCSCDEDEETCSLVIDAPEPGTYYIAMQSGKSNWVRAKSSPLVLWAENPVPEFVSFDSRKKTVSFKLQGYGLESTTAAGLFCYREGTAMNISRAEVEVSDYYSSESECKSAGGKLGVLVYSSQSTWTGQPKNLEDGQKYSIAARQKSPGTENYGAWSETSAFELLVEQEEDEED